jgi:ubiquinone/menaquinone biosynthesis C-methylase UbiE/N-acyl-L-homoserine lactone synthetase
MKKFWDFYAKVYDCLRNFPPYIKMQQQVIENLQLISELKIIDVGCGTGNTIKRLINNQKSKRWEIIGLDVSSPMLHRAAKKLKNFYNIQLRLADFNSLDSADEKYDRIISINGLYASPDPLKTLIIWRDCLVEGGVLVIVNPFSLEQWSVYREYFKGIREKRDIMELFRFIFRFPIWLLFIGINQIIGWKAKKRQLNFLLPNELKESVIKAGFKVLNQETVYGGGFTLLSLQKISHIAIRRAQLPSEIEAAYQLRYKIYCQEKKMVPLEICLDGQEIDRFDSCAVHFIAMDKDKIIGCARVFTDYGEGFLLEEYFSLPEELKGKRGGVLEISRALLLPEYRDGSFFFDLMDGVADWGVNRGYKYFIGASTEKIWEKFRSNGWEIKIWAGYKDYHNTFSAPAFIFPPISKK